MAWAAAVPSPLVRLIGLAEILGALGVVLPEATGHYVWLTPLAAACLVVLQLLAIIVHVRRGETRQLGINIVLLVLAGITQSITMVCHTVILLRVSGQKMRGRVTGVRMLAIYTLPIGLLSAGALVEVIGFRATVSLYTIVGLIFTVLIAVRWRNSLWQLRNLDTD
jgi:sugar phosphate permease